VRCIAVGRSSVKTEVVDHLQVGEYWEENAGTWTQLSRAGYDTYRDYLNTPAFLGLLPSVSGLRGLDVGCGEGHNTRLLGGLGARMVALDISRRFLVAAAQLERLAPLGIGYLRASAHKIPLASESVDFATAFMSLMDMPELDAVLVEICRVVRPGGFLQFSIEHPCTATPVTGWHLDREGRRVGRIIGGYFAEECYVSEWGPFSSAPSELREGKAPFRIPRFPRTLSSWVTSLLDAGFTIEAMAEPRASNDAIAEYPKLAATQNIPFFLHIRCRKPAARTDS
jgi:ubiquinone/menaquinone biosynthesis C-methylase UbiE